MDAEPKKKRMLAADDEAGLRRAYHNLFYVGAGYDLVLVETCADAEELLFPNGGPTGGDYDCVLLDNRTPKGRLGIDVLRRMQAEGLIGKIRVAICSSDIDGLKAAVESCGAGFFSKPFKNKELVAYFSQ